MNISPFRDQLDLWKFVTHAPAAFCLLPIALAFQSIWFAAFAIATPLLTIWFERFKFLWQHAPWFKSAIGLVLLCQIPLVALVAFWPSLWIALIGYVVGLLAGGGYGAERERLAREFNIPEKG